jgi:hypothetical protein
MSSNPVPTPLVAAPSAPATTPISVLLRQRLRGGYRFVLEHLALVGVALYAYVTLVGLAFSEAMYWRIGINPLNYFGPTDFLLAGLQHPGAVILPPFILLLSYAWTILLWLPSVWTVKKFFVRYGSGLASRYPVVFAPQIGSRAERLVRQWVYFNLFAVTLEALAGLFLMPFMSVEAVSECHQPVQISLRADAVGEKQAAISQKFVIIGSSQTMLFAIDQKSHLYTAIPTDTVASIGASQPAKQQLLKKIACTVMQ